MSAGEPARGGEGPMRHATVALFRQEPLEQLPHQIRVRPIEEREPARHLVPDRRNLVSGKAAYRFLNRRVREARLASERKQACRSLDADRWTAPTLRLVKLLSASGVVDWIGMGAGKQQDLADQSTRPGALGQITTLCPCSACRG
jgi:hypothetical protein